MSQSEKEYYQLTEDSIESELSEDSGYQEWAETIEKQNQEQQDDDNRSQ